MRQVIGCIGCGNMGSAIMKGFADKLPRDEYHLCVYDNDQAKMDALKGAGVETMESVAATAANSDLLIFAVKPHQMPEVLQEAQPEMKQNKAALSIAAGISLSRLRLMLGDECFICRCMPTTTALVGHGIFAFCYDPVVSMPEMQKNIQALFKYLGVCMELPEVEFTNFSALVGAGPAYIFDFMQGLVQAGVTLGFTFSQSQKIFSEMMTGCGKMAIGNSKSFMQLRNDVCSPGGLTIAGINVLDRAGLAGLVVEAVEKAVERGKEMES